MKQVLIILLAILFIIGIILPVWNGQNPTKESGLLTIEDEAIALGDLSLPNAYGLNSAWLEGVFFQALGSSPVTPGFIGQTRMQIEEVLGEPLKVYGHTTIVALNTSTRSYYALNEDILLVYYDNKKQMRALFTLQFNDRIAQKTRFMTQPVYDATSITQMTADTAVLLNGIRKNYQRGSLKLSSELSSVSLRHSLDMVKNSYFSHTNSEGIGPKARIQKAKISFKAFGEALTAGTYTPVEALTSWLNSEGHRPIVLGDYNTLGLGIATGETTYGIYYTLKVIKQ